MTRTAMETKKTGEPFLSPEGELLLSKVAPPTDSITHPDTPVSTQSKQAVKKVLCEVAR